jgi:hypothetical protein
LGLLRKRRKLPGPGQAGAGQDQGKDDNRDHTAYLGSGEQWNREVS